MPAAAMRSRPAATQAARADAPQAVTASVSQIDVASRSWSGSTAASETAVTTIDEIGSHHPSPAGPNGMPVASDTAAATSCPSGTVPPHAMTTSTIANHPHARNRPLKSSRRCRRISRTISAIPAAANR